MTAEYIWPWAGGLECSAPGCKGDVTHRVEGVLFCRAHLPVTNATSGTSNAMRQQAADADYEEPLLKQLRIKEIHVARLSEEREMARYRAAKAEEALNALQAEVTALRKALDVCETALSPAMANHDCGDMPASGTRCGECLGCMNWAAWQFAREALAPGATEGA